MKRRPSPSVAVSAVVHVLAIVGLARVLAVPSGVMSFFDKRQGEIPADRIGFVQLPQSSTGQTTPGVSGGDGRPATREREVRGLVAPDRIPSGIPDVPVAPVSPETESGSGPLVGTGGPRRGVRPEYHDPRLWREPTAVVTAPRSVREQVDAIIAEDVGRVTDSVLAAGPRRAPGDWTFERNGRKYGIDQQFIRLGPVSIPTAVLALLPINAQANPGEIERERALRYMNADIRHHAQRAITEDEFRRNVRNLRERKDREKAEAEGRGNERERQETAPAAPQDEQTR